MYHHPPHRNLSLSTPQNSATSKPVSPHVGFYKTFGRPIAKVFLGAVFTYQFTYLAWMRLESDEIKGRKRDEVLELERELKGLTS